MTQLKVKHVLVSLHADMNSSEELFRFKLTPNKPSSSDMNVEMYDSAAINYEVVSKDNKRYCFTLLSIVSNIKDDNVQQFFFVKPMVTDLNYNVVTQYGWISLGCSISYGAKGTESFIGDVKLPIYGEKVTLYQRLYTDGVLSDLTMVRGNIKLPVTLVSRYLSDDRFREECDKQFSEFIAQDKRLLETLTSLGL